MSKTALPIDESFFETAALILPATIEIPHSPQQVWAALIDDRMGAWMSIIDHAAWRTPPPRHGGARRTVRVARFLTLEEEFFLWEDQRRIGFRAVDIRPGVVSGWAEQGYLEPLPDGGTRITYTIAVDAPFLRFVPIPGFVMRAAAVVAGRAMSGIVSVLPPPESGEHPVRGDAGLKVRFRATPRPARNPLGIHAIKSPESSPRIKSLSNVVEPQQQPSQGTLMTQSTSTPAQLAARLVTTFGDPDNMAAALAEDVTWWESPSAPPEIMASVSTGRDTVRGNMQRVFSLIYNGSTVNTTVHHAISQENMGVVRFTMTAEFPNGADYENEYTVWVEIRDGEIVKVWEYVDAAWTLAQMQSAGIELPSLG